MITISPIDLEGIIFTAIKIELPNTNLCTISNEIGYIVGATFKLSLDEAVKSNHIIAATVFDVNEIDELLYQPLMVVTKLASDVYGWKKGMSVREALLLIA